MLVLFDRQHVFTYLKVLFNPHYLKWIYRACASCWLFTAHIETLKINPLKFYAGRKLPLIFCPHQTCYFCSLVCCLSKEKWYIKLVFRGTWVFKEMLDRIQFQLDNIFHLLPLLRLRIIWCVFLQLPFLFCATPHLHLCIFLFQIPEVSLVFFVVKLSMLELSCC